MPYAIFLYTLGLSLPGIFFINPGSVAYILYQVVSLLGIALFILINYLKHKKKLSFLKSVLYFSFAYTGILTATALYSIHLAIADNRSLGSIAQFLLPPALCLVLLIGSGYSRLSPKIIDRFLGFIIVFTLFCALYGMVVNYDTIISLSSITNSYNADIKGFFANRNIFGYMLALGAACGTFLFTKNRKKILLPAIVILLTGTVLSMSRGAILLYVIFLIAFILLKSKKKIKALALITTTLAIAYSTLSSFAFIQDNIIRLDNGDTGRSELRSYGIQHFLDNNLLLGSGERAINSIEAKFQHSSFHNLYIETLATQGLVGFVALIVCMLYVWSNIRLIKKYDRVNYAFFAALFFAYMVYCLIEALPLFYGTPNSALTTFVLVLLPIFMINSLKARKGYIQHEKRD
ncbi:MAG: O-antigen ligase family protein [Candidatus Saccharibacteria bacterium]|nr:O-antigen ligase family protein [Candidatus Saccharibacteria bacterium]